MNLKHFLLSIITLFAMGHVTSASAGSMRCGVHLIQDGSANGPGKYEVEKKCGSPAGRYRGIGPGASAPRGSHVRSERHHRSASQARRRSPRRETKISKNRFF